MYKRYTYSNEATATLLARKVGDYVVNVIERLNHRENSGKWVVMINGVASRWYGMESAAINCAKRFRVTKYGYSFGEPA